LKSVGYDVVSGVNDNADEGCT